MQRMLLPLLMLGLASTAFAIEIDDPRFAAVDCWFDESQVAAEADCYRFTLPQDHSDPDGRSISIPVLHVASEQQTDKAPLVMMGSGALGVSIAFEYPDNIDLWLDEVSRISYQQDRDFFWFDVRGVGFSEPSLSCPQTIELFDQYLAGDVSLAELRTQHIEMLQSCGRDFARQGVDFNHYTTVSLVEDIEQLRQAIEVPKLLLFGSFYSAIYAKEYAETYPDAVAGLILDNPFFMGRTRAQMLSQMGRQFERNITGTCSANRVTCDDPNRLPEVIALHQSYGESPKVGYGYSETLGNIPIRWDDDKVLQFLLNISAIPYIYEDMLGIWLDELEEGYDLSPLSTFFRDVSTFDYVNYLPIAANECAEALPFSGDEATGNSRLPWLEASPVADLSPLCETLAIEPVPESVYAQQVIEQPTVIIHGSINTLVPSKYIDRFRDRFANLEFVRITSRNTAIFDEQADEPVQAFVDGLAH